jgi:hypothetical protein
MAAQAAKLERGDFGPQYPAGIGWPENVERIDHLPPTARKNWKIASRKRRASERCAASYLQVHNVNRARRFAVKPCLPITITNKAAAVERTAGAEQREPL